MSPAWKYSILTASHLAVIVLSAIAFVDWERESREQVALGDPLYRVGLHFPSLGDTPADGLSSAQSELPAVESALGPPAALVGRLIMALRGLDSGGALNREAAGAVCRQLGWPRCDDQSLVKMRALVVR